MRIFSPSYYKSFKCIAEKCTHSCCVGWEIDIDEKSLHRYEKAEGKYPDEIRKSIEYGDTPHFRLRENERCPHLDERGLCRIIIECGEDFLCDICKEHPRFYNETSLGLEVGIGMACEEAARIILSSDGYADFGGEAEPCDGFDAVAERERIYKILSDNSLPYEARLKKIYESYGIAPTATADEEWHEIISSLEYLDEGHRDAFLCYSSDTKTPKRYEKILERALAYFIFRHASARDNEEDSRAALGFACFMERLFASLLKSDSDGEKNAITLARIISEEIEYSEDNTEEIMQNFIF